MQPDSVTRHVWVSVNAESAFLCNVHMGSATDGELVMLDSCQQKNVSTKSVRLTDVRWIYTASTTSVMIFWSLGGKNLKN